MPHGTASMHRLLPALPLTALLLSCGGTPKAPDPGTDYTLVVQPNLITTPAVTGGGGRGLATVAWINCAPQTVDLTLAGAPAGLNASFAPASTSATSTYNLALANVPPPAGLYHMWVQGVAADVHHRTELDLAVQDFALAQPADVTVPAAAPSFSIPITFTRQPAELPFAGSVDFTVTTPATFYVGSFNPTPVVNPGTTTTLTMNSGGVPPGSATVTVTGRDAASGLTHSVTFTVTLQ
ncbi:MAG TPA: hypothetical protein VFF76_11135 [Holophagaceae bacterium]|nr:hypothetical protein [Holophagaceae bacterium]